MFPSDICYKRILFSPLNWGYGHVARSIQIINELIKSNNTIYIACSESQYNIYLNYFSSNQFTWILHIDYPFNFKGNGYFINDIFSSIFSLYNRLIIEKKQADNLVDQFSIDIIISDHRYGFLSQKVPSIFVTHQLNLPLSNFGFFFQFIHQKLISKFNYIWVLDDQNNHFAGKLSKRKKSNKLHFIGVKSRFSLYTNELTKEYDRVVVVSGPEPYAEQFFIEQLECFKESVNTVIISPKHYSIQDINYQCKIVLASNWLEVDQIIRQSKKLISRSGYSTIMDLYFLQIPFEFHPTKGQAEQIYLADLHKKFNG